MPKRSMQDYIDSQVKYWKQRKDMIETVEKKSVSPFITISREYGCGGYEIAESVIRIINAENPTPLWGAYDRKVLEHLMKDMGMSQTLVETLTSRARSTMTNILQTTLSKFPPQVAVYRKLVEIVRLLAYNGHVIIVGRGGNAITRDMESAFHVRIIAPLEWRIENLHNKNNISKKDAEKLVKEKENDRENFIKEFVKFDITDPENYDICINNAKYSTDQVAHVIIESMKIKGLISRQ